MYDPATQQLDLHWDSKTIQAYKQVPAEVWRTGRRVFRPSTPDRDNVDKAHLDGAQMPGRFEVRGLLANDAQAVDGRIRKFWAAKGEQPHTVITVWLSPWLDDDEAGA